MAIKNFYKTTVHEQSDIQKIIAILKSIFVSEIKRHVLIHCHVFRSSLVVFRVKLRAICVCMYGI